MENSAANIVWKTQRGAFIWKTQRGPFLLSPSSHLLATHGTATGTCHGIILEYGN